MGPNITIKRINTVIQFEVLYIYLKSITINEKSLNDSG